MARIPDAEIERIKREIALERLVAGQGIRLRRHGKDLLGLCPFHDDHEPSLVVSPHKNLWHCLGACRQGGSVIDWVMKTEGVSFRHAVELLRQDYAPSGQRATRALKRSQTQKLPAAVDRQAEDAELLGQVIDYYHESLKQSPEALAYLESRGLHFQEAIEHFRLGFSNRTLGYRLPAKDRRAGSEIRARLQQLGILRDSGHEHFNGSLVIPVFNRQGQVVEIYGRKVTARLRKGTPLHLYLPGPHRGVWNLEALASSKEVILCESLIDALTFWCAGFRQVTAAYGIEGFTQEHLEAFTAYGIERVLLAYDRDEAGEKASRALAEKLLAEGIGCYRVLFPRGMDANEYALKVQPAQKSLDLVLRQAEWMGTGPPPAISVPTLPHCAPASDEADVQVDEGSVSSDGESDVPEAVAASEGISSTISPLAAAADPSGDSPSPSKSSSSDKASTSVTEAEPAVKPQPPSLLPQTPKLEIPVELKDQEVIIPLGDRRYRVRGLEKNLSYDALRINLLASRGEAFHIDTFDLYSAHKRAQFLKQVATELGIEAKLAKQDLGKVLLKLEELQDEQIQKALAPSETAVTLSPEERQEALELLRDPRLLERILEDFERCGVVGEETNKLIGYLAAVSRKDDQPLAVLLQSSSATGKSALMEAILAFVPEEERAAYSAMTGQSLFYLGEKDLRHKVLAIAEEEGAERASYALKLLQSEGKLSIASTGKDPQTGRLLTHEYHVEGPVAILLTTTAIDLDEELLNRCLVLTVDEGREQTRAIHRKQRERETLAGQLELRQRRRVRQVHQNAQRLLEPLTVVNPYAKALGFPDSCPRTRRDHEKYLALIRAVTLLHQHQRERRVNHHQGQGVPYIEVTVQDLEIANRLAHEVLGRTLDELPPQTRRLLLMMDKLVDQACEQEAVEREAFRFPRRWLRQATGWGDTQLKVHLARLVDMEYLVVHRSSHAQRHLYELVYDGQGKNGQPFLPGLIDVTTLGYDANRSGLKPNRSGGNANRSGQNPNRSAPGRPLVGGWSGGGRIEEPPLLADSWSENRQLSSENAPREPIETPSSYSQERRSSNAAEA